MRIDGNRLMAERFVQHDIRRLAPDARQAGQFLPRLRHLAIELIDQELRQGDHILRLVPPEADRPDMPGHALFAKRQHLFRRIGNGEQLLRRLVDADISCLSGQGDGDNKGKRIVIFQLGLRCRAVFGERRVELRGLFRPERCRAALFPDLRLCLSHQEAVLIAARS